MDAERFGATRIGLIADTHDEIVDWSDFQESVAKAFAGVGLILHCGDLTAYPVLDALEQIAPVRAVRSPGDPDVAPPRLIDGPRFVEVSGHLICLQNVLDETTTGDATTVVHGGTHQPSLEERDGSLFVNPGSPTLSEQRSVAILEVVGDTMQGRIVEL
jgi:putative phosphoesterase